MPDQPERPNNRTVTLVLVTPTGELVGALAPFDVDSPWWTETQPVIRRARELTGADLTILRLLEGDPGRSDGRATYLAEVERAVPAKPWSGALADHPLRMPWARPGGPAADIAWATQSLAAHGIALVGPPEQVRTWNLSSLWRLPVDGETIWFKTVPPFFEHEARMLDRLQGAAPVSVLLAHEGRRMLLREIGGVDLYQPTAEQRLQMVNQLVDIQHAWIGRIDELLHLRLPDWRAESLTRMIREVVDRVASELSAQTSLPWAASSTASSVASASLPTAACPTAWCMATSTRATTAATIPVSCYWIGATRASGTRCSTSRPSSSGCQRTSWPPCASTGMPRGER